MVICRASQIVSLEICSQFSSCRTDNSVLDLKMSTVCRRAKNPREMIRRISPWASLKENVGGSQDTHDANFPRSVPLYGNGEWVYIPTKASSAPVFKEISSALTSSFASDGMQSKISIE
jgi:hypothetical protein